LSFPRPFQQSLAGFWDARSQAIAKLLVKTVFFSRPDDGLGLFLQIFVCTDIGVPAVFTL